MTEFILVIIEFHYSTKTPASKLSIWVGGGGWGEGSWDHIRVAREKRREYKVRFARHIKWRGCSDGFVQLRQVAICILLVRWPILARSYILRTRWRHQRGICARRENRAHFHSCAFLCVLESPSKNNLRSICRVMDLLSHHLYQFSW